MRLASLVYVMLCYVMQCYANSLCYGVPPLVLPQPPSCYVNVMLCYGMLCHAMLCYVVLRYVTQCYVMLCCVITPNVVKKYAVAYNIYVT